MRSYLWGIVAAGIASAAGVALIVVQTTPDTASPLLKTLFFLALFVFLWSAATLVIYAIRRRALESSFITGFAVAFLTLAVILIRKLY